MTKDFNNRLRLKWSRFYDEPKRRITYMARLLVMDFDDWYFEWVLLVGKLNGKYRFGVYLEKKHETPHPIPLTDSHPTLVEAQIAAESFLDSLVTMSIDAMRDASSHKTGYLFTNLKE